MVTVVPLSAQWEPERGDTMTLTLTVLLCLGLSVDSRTRVQTGTRPKPNIWAEPGFVIPWWTSVTIWCQGGLEAQEYRLHKEGKLETWDRQKPLEPGDKAKFFIRYMRVMHTGRYRCNYLSPTGWSELSEPLVLVMTGLQNKPQLSALPSHVVTPGRNVTLQCGSWLGFDRFVLMKEGENQPSWTMVSQRAPRGGTHALFPVGPVNTSLRWTFRCYGYYNTTSQIWSHPSDPLELLASGHKHQRSWIPVPVTFFLMLFLLLLFLLVRHQRQKKCCKSSASRPQVETKTLQKSSSSVAPVQDENKKAEVRESQPEEDIQMDSEAMASEEPQDVTHAQRNSLNLGQETSAPPSSQSTEAPAEPSECAALSMH
uniref:Ig-like domain-containing protein n=2 Tax=Mustela TaxID=9665 RepID=M3YGX4_MUSPF